ncbi:hypothetical protein RvY_03285-2 [Ramazzottius varieornatus]|uniref:guanylate cyclase n=1 Tax=Ramazzottius varieornatus TaxID=947166 RepID=A0A1D1UMI9_RAMVA|nr:hypothetical protein RvY_03285-2 [Ramazzottius varieornatus]
MPDNRWLQVWTAPILYIVLLVAGQDDRLVVKVALLLMHDDLQEAPDMYLRPVLRAAADAILDNYGIDMQFMFDFPMMTACANSSGSPAVSRTFIQVFEYYQQQADVVIGPYCTAKLPPSGIATSALNILQVTGGCHSVLDISSYTYLTRTGYAKMNQFGLIKYMLEKYRWKTLMVFYQKDSPDRLADYQAFAARDAEDTNFAGTYLAITSADLTTSKIGDVLTTVGQSARVVVLLMDNAIVRRIMIEAAKMGMVGGDYVYFAVDVLGAEITRNNATNGWRDEADTADNNDLAKKAYASLLVVSLRDRSQNPDYQKNIASIFVKAKDPSLYGGSGPYQLPYSAESFYNSLVFVADVVTRMDGQQKDINARNITQVTSNYYINGPDDWIITGGLCGDFAIDTHTGDVEESYQLYAMTDKGAGYFAGLLVSGGADSRLNVTTINPSFTWTSSDGSFPPNEPACDYTGDNSACAAEASGQIAGIVSSLLSLALVASLALAYRHWKRMNELEPGWVVPFSELKVTDPDVQLSKTAAAPDAKPSREAEQDGSQWNVPQDTSHECMLGDLPTLTSPSLGLCRKQSVTVRWMKKKRVQASAKMAQEVKALGKMANDHLAKLLAGCLDSGRILLIYENCSRGSLEESVNDVTSKFEWPLRFSYMQDIVRALHYIHSSPVRVHGRLSSACCFIDSRFTLKVSDVGLSSFLDLNLAEYWVTKRRVDFYYRQFWTAPELLKSQEALWDQVVICSQRQCDIYSFGIIMQEIILHAPPYSMYDDTFTDQRRHLSENRGRASSRSASFSAFIGGDGGA